MLITVALSVEEYKALEKLARHRANMDAGTLLRCVAGDLTHSGWSGGSDERMYAHQWLDRRFDIGERFDIGPVWANPSQRFDPAAGGPDDFDQRVAGKGGAS